MKTVAVILLLAISAQAQSLADAARKERERQATLRPSRVFTSIGSTTPAPPNPGSPAPATAASEAVHPPAAALGDPAKLWNDQLDQLRMKIRNLQDQETALQLQQNQLTNQIYAPVIDPDSKAQAQGQLAQSQQQLAAVRMELDEARKTLDSMQLQGPPKK